MSAALPEFKLIVMDQFIGWLQSAFFIAAESDDGNT
jgi:hypothetical protein